MSLLLLLISGPGYQLGFWHFRKGILMVMASGVISIPALVLGAVAWFRRSNMGLAIPATIIGALLFMLAASWARTAKTVPPIHDITTDTQNPPEFVAVVPLRSDAANPVAYGGPEIARQQKEAYPDIQTELLSVPPAHAFERAENLARKMRWEIVSADPASGRIEATVKTFWFGFKDDVVVRIEPVDSGSKVDVRSASRVGVSDLGANAKRIRVFLKQLRSAS